MNFSELINKRQSIRAFQDKEVEKASIEAILECVRAAPSAGNAQAYHVVLVQDEQQKAALARATFGQGFLESAPVVLAFICDRQRSGMRYGQRGEQLYALQDATIACVYAQLAVVDLGLASCWVGAFDDAAVARVLGVPAGMAPVALLPIGHAAEQPEPTGRRPASEMISSEKVGS